MIVIVMPSSILIHYGGFIMLFVAKDQTGMPFGYYQANSVKEVREYLSQCLVGDYEISVVEVCDLVEKKKIMGKYYPHSVKAKDAIRMFKAKIGKV